MQQHPLVTIICLCYNHEKFVVESLQSVVNQSYKNIELVVVDDCSGDNSVTVIKKWLLDYPQVRFIANDTNWGSTKSFNQAAQFAKGNYLIDLAADDILLENCVQLQVEKFKNSIYKNLAIVYGNAQNIDEKGNFLSNYFEFDANKKVIEKRPTGNIYKRIIAAGKPFCSVSAMYKKTVFDTLNGYDQTLEYEDLDYWVRVSRSFSIDFVDKILVQKRILNTAQSNGFFKPNTKINQSTYQILKKIIQLNQSADEDLAVQTRVHFEIINAYKNKDFSLLFKNIGLRIWLLWRRFF